MIAVPMRVSTTAVSVPVSVSDDGVNIAVGIGAAYTLVEGKPYEGETIVDPILYNPVILETKDKLVSEDITVNPIRILDVDNPAGGYTVTIGKI